MIYSIFRIFGIFMPRNLRHKYISWLKNRFDLHTIVSNIVGKKSDDFYWINRAISDPTGMGMADLLMFKSMGINQNQKNIIYGIVPGAICIDCGVNRGKFIDLCNIFGAKIFGFELNPRLIPFLEHKYKNADNIRLIAAGVGIQECEVDFYFNQNNLTDEGGSLYKNVAADVGGVTKTTVAKARIIDLCDFIDNEFITKNQRVYLLKMDIEGAEFGLVEKMIESGVYKHIDHIILETHERFFDDGEARLKKLNDAISKAGATNINLEMPQHATTNV